MKSMTLHPVRAVRGSLEVPGDKSVSHRAIMMGSLGLGTTHVDNFLSSADCLSTARIFKSLGAKITRKGSRVVIEGRGLYGLKCPGRLLDAGNSGTTGRILLGLLAGQTFTSRLTGDKYLRKRPMRRVTEPVTRMGANFTGRDRASFLPIRVEGSPLKGISYRMPVASAQVKSAMLLAGLYAEGETAVVEKMPTRDHTERMFAAFGIPFRREGLRVSVTGPATPFKGCRVRVPGDISSAAFFIVAALLAPGSRLVLKGVGVNPTRTGILDVLKRMGGRIRVKPLRGVGAPNPSPTFGWKARA
jgi:3-phosphoshikimate 1-carboxyvinyltransferase